MKRRKIRSLSVSEIGMGCMGFSHGYGQVPGAGYAEEAIREAFGYGCNFFDTAEGYGKELYYPGHNEEIVGRAVRGFRNEVVIATNCISGLRRLKIAAPFMLPSAATLNAR